MVRTGRKYPGGATLRAPLVVIINNSVQKFKNNSVQKFKNQDDPSWQHFWQPLFLAAPGFRWRGGGRSMPAVYNIALF